MKLLSKILIICMLAFLVAPVTSAFESDVLNTFLHFTDSATTAPQTIMEGESIRVTATTYGNDGALEMEHLYIVNGPTLFKSYLPGNYNSEDDSYHFTRTHTINTAQLKISPGTYKVGFHVVDRNGEQEISYLTLVVTPYVDDVKPVVTIEYPEHGKTYTDFVKNFKYKAEDDNLDYCYYSLNGGSTVQMNCYDNVWYLIGISTLEGYNSLSVYAVDTFGNIGVKSINFNIDIPEVDEEKPIVTISYPTEGTTYNDYVNYFRFKAEDKNLFQCHYVLNGASPVLTACDDNIWKSVSISTREGNNYLTVYAKDTFGNVGTDSVNFRVEFDIPDTEKPIVDIRYPTDGRTYTNYVNDFEFKAIDEELYNCWYSLNGGPATDVACVNDVWKQVDIDSIRGTNTLTVWARDASNNVGHDSVTFTVYIDDVKPVVEILTPEEKLYTYKVTDATFTVEDDNLQICSYKLNDNDREIIDCDVNVINEIHDLFSVKGYNTLTVWAKDIYGNEGYDSVVYRMDYGDVDSTDPVVEILFPEEQTYEEVNEFRFTVEEEFLDRCWYVLNGNRVRVTDCTNGLNIVNNPNVREGQNTLIVWAEDLADNRGSDSVVFTIEKPVDPNEPPVITVITPRVNGEYEEYITFDLRVNEDADVVYSLDGGDFIDMDEVSSLRFNSDRLSPSLGWHEVEFCATDVEGLESCVLVRFRMIEDDDDDDDKKCKSCSNIDWDSWYKELDDFYAKQKAEDDTKRRNAIHLTEDLVNTIIEVTFGEKVYYGVVAYVIALIILVTMLLFFVERKKTLSKRYRLY